MTWGSSSNRSCWRRRSSAWARAGSPEPTTPSEPATPWICDQERSGAAVCALGHPEEEGYGRLHTKVIRRLAGGHKRKPLTDIVFSGRWGEPWSPEEADPALVTVLEHARLAPSAHNAQPWRFIVDHDRIALALTRPMLIDGGIVMSHVTLAAGAVERGGEWELGLRDDRLAAECGLPEKALPIGTFRFATS